MVRYAYRVAYVINSVVNPWLRYYRNLLCCAHREECENMKRGTALGYIQSDRISYCHRFGITYFDGTYVFVFHFPYNIC